MGYTLEEAEEADPAELQVLLSCFLSAASAL